jgi:hypothetical protein
MFGYRNAERIMIISQKKSKKLFLKNTASLLNNNWMSNDLSVKNRLIFLRGGFAGYLLAKRGEKIWNKILD